MAGTIAGGRKAAIRNKAKHGHDFYSRIGRIGGKVSTPKGFALNRALASRAGKKGGTISKRGKSHV